MKPTHPTAPSSAGESHRTALEQALREAVGTSQPALRRQALDRAAQHLVHPRHVLESPLLDDRHPWRLEALAVADAFEAVTNGMEDPALLEALDDLAPGSPFEAWRHLVLALHFFHEGLDEAVRAHVAALPPQSPPAALGRVLTHLIGPRDPRLPAPAARLADAAARPDPALVQAVQDVAEGLEGDHEGLFWEAFAEWLDRLAPGAPDTGKAAVLWAWKQLEWRDFDEAVLVDLSAAHWGRPEAFRLAALGTAAWDPEGAVLLWHRFLLGALREEALAADDLTRARALADRFLASALEDDEGLSAEGRTTLEALQALWNQEAAARGQGHLRFGALPGPLGLPGQNDPHHEPAPAGAEAPPGPGAQLDLFGGLL